MLINHYTRTSRRFILKKEITFLKQFAFLYLKNGFRQKTVLFYPEYPLWETEIYKIIRLLGYNITNNPRLKYDLVVRWEDTTFQREYPLLDELSQKVPVINLNCRDISKRKVEEVSQEVFGYGTFVDPVTHHGECVRKSDLNALHDGKIIQCPIEAPEEGFIYQKLLKNISEDNQAIDYRITIFGDSIPYTWLRYKPLSSRFDKTTRATYANSEDVFSADELSKLKLFCQKFGLQYGELDIIRHQEDGRVYVLDVNNTPWSPPPTANLDPEKRKLSLQQSMDAFRKTFFER